MNRTYGPFGAAIDIYHAATASKLYEAFLSVRFAPRKKDHKVEKSIKRSWSNPHQGKQEIARRYRQIQRGIIQPSAMVAR